MGNSVACVVPEGQLYESVIPSKRSRFPLSGGGLAARRNLSGAWKVATEQKTGCGSQPPGFRRIQWCSKLSDKYDIGSEVTPSCHAGMRVLFGRMKPSGTDVVIKMRAKRNSFRGSEEKQWRESMESMLNLQPSPNICQVLEVLEDEKNYYVVMEKCEGADLFESSKGSGKLTIDECKDVLTQILIALSGLHARGLVHKDLKHNNVMIDRTPTASPKSPQQLWHSSEASASPFAVKLIDFDTVEEHTPETPKKAKDVLGSDQYIAPDAYAGNYSPASDVFAVGVIAYQLLVGRFPFDMRIFDDQPGENWVGSPKMNEIRAKVCKYKVNYDHKVFQQEPQAYDLVKSMLAVNKLDRLTVQECLSHPWLASDEHDAKVLRISL